MTGLESFLIDSGFSRLADAKSWHKYDNHDHWLKRKAGVLDSGYLLVEIDTASVKSPLPVDHIHIYSKPFKQLVMATFSEKSAVKYIREFLDYQTVEYSIES